MKGFILKALALSVAALLLFALAACNKAEDQKASPTATPASDKVDPGAKSKDSGSKKVSRDEVNMVKFVSDELPLTVNANEGFNSEGFICLVAGEDMRLKVDFGDTDVLDWEIYVFNGEYTGALSGLRSGNKPEVSESGAELKVAEGQYIYLYRPAKTASAGSDVKGSVTFYKVED